MSCSIGLVGGMTLPFGNRIVLLGICLERPSAILYRAAYTESSELRGKLCMRQEDSFFSSFWLEKEET